MESSFDLANESLNPQQPLKVDDKQNLFTNTLMIGTVESISQSSGLGLNHTVQSAIDKWAGKQAIDLSSPINNPIASKNSFRSAAISVVQSPFTKIYQTPLATLITAPAVVKKPADIAPTGLVINGLKFIYGTDYTLSIDPSFVVDADGWKDVSKVDFWLTDSKGKRVELPDVTSFVAKDIKDKNSAKFSYSTSLIGITAGDYKLNAVAYDKFGAKSNQVTKEIGIKPINFVPNTSIRTDKSIYEANSVLSIDIGKAWDGNGWQDIKKIDFWLTNSQNQRIELDDVNTFSRDSQTSIHAKFNYSTSLQGFAAGDYKLNAIAYDKVGAASSKSTSSFKIKPVNSAPQAIVIPKIQGGVNDNSFTARNITISDRDGWDDITKVDFWLTNAQNQRIELGDVSFFDSLVLWNGENIDSNSLKFDYTIATSYLIPGNYRLNAVVYDKHGAASTQFTQPDEIKIKNFAPNEGQYKQNLFDYVGLKSNLFGDIESMSARNSFSQVDSSEKLFTDKIKCKTNSIITINETIEDKNGWEDIKKVDFWLTDSKGLRIELTDANSFTSNGTYHRNTARFNYSTSLEGVASGYYTLNAIAYDRSGASSIQSKRGIMIEDTNIIPPLTSSSGITESTTPSVVFNPLGKISRNTTFSVKNQNADGSGKGSPINFSFGDEKLLNQEWNILGNKFSLEAGAKFGFSASEGTFDLNMPTQFDIAWKANQDSNFMDITFTSKLALSDVELNTAQGADLTANLNAKAAVCQQLPLMPEEKFEIGVSAGLNLSKVLSAVSSPVNLDLAWNAKGKVDGDSIKAEDTAFEAIDIINSLALWGGPATILAAKAVQEAGISAKVGAEIKQTSQFSVVGFEVDYDGIENGDKDKKTIYGSNNSVVFKVPVISGKEFKFSPTIRPITKFQSDFGLSLKLAAGIDFDLLGKKTQDKLNLPILKQFLPTISLEKSIQTPFGSYWTGKEFDPFYFMTAKKLEEITIPSNQLAVSGIG
jgi:hypothetical protein